MAFFDTNYLQIKPKYDKKDMFPRVFPSFQEYNNLF